MAKIKVAVLRGGPSPEYDVSLKTGGRILSLLREMGDKYEPVDIFISKDGEWHSSGLVYEPHRALERTDAVWNALHGAYGEDGQVQKLLEALKIPYTGSRAFSSAVSMNKDLAKSVYIRHSLATPAHEVLTKDNLDNARLVHIFRNYHHPVVIKPVSGGSGIGVETAHGFYELKDKVERAIKMFGSALVEEMIRGRAVSRTVIEGARGEKLYVLLSSAGSEELDADTAREVEEMARAAHRALGLRHYSESDFIVTPKKKIYILETNSLPALHEDSLTHSSLHASGWKPGDFVDHVLKLAVS